MRGLPRRVPAGATTQVRSGEKVIAWGVRSPDAGTYVVATNRALYLAEERLPWHGISKATWDDPVLDLVLVSVDGGR